jgi:hypothetical protein
VLAGIFAWRRSSTSAVVARARQIRVGQPRSEVVQIMGWPQMTYNAGTVGGECYSSMATAEWTIRILLNRYLGLDVIPDPVEFEVEFQYDKVGQVSSVRTEPKFDTP